jgi:hypothetical protein
MSDLLSKPNVSEKKEGDRLYHTDINEITKSIGRTVTEVNKRMISFCNINIEELNNNFSKKLTLSEAISLVKPNRRVPGIIIKFIEIEENGWVEYQYKAIDTTSSWTDLNNWEKLGDINIIDGGLF